MFLSDLFGKPIVVSSAMRGICLGVGFSLKNFSIKYLLCSSSPNRNQVDFCINISSVDKIGEAVYLTRLRPVFPKSCARILPNLPIFSFDGGYFGKIADLEIQNFVAIRLFTDKKQAIPCTAISACADAVILRKEQPFPLGQRVPAPVLSLFSDKTDALVTRPVLRSAMEKSALIKLTLSLPPFNVDFYPQKG